MTRRSEKQIESSWYVSDGNAGEVWLAWGVNTDSEDPWAPNVLLDVFNREQTANQFAQWRHHAHGLQGEAPAATKRILRTKMRKWG